jgi:hypothetical protein
VLNLKLETSGINLECLEQAVQVLVDVFLLHYFFVVERNAIVGVDPADHAEEEAVPGNLEGGTAQTLEQTPIALELGVQFVVDGFGRGGTSAFFVPGCKLLENEAVGFGLKESAFHHRVIGEERGRLDVFLYFRYVLDLLGHVLFPSLGTFLGSLLGVEQLSHCDEDKPDDSLQNCSQDQHDHDMAEHEEEQGQTPPSPCSGRVVEGDSRPPCLCEHLN